MDIVGYFSQIFFQYVLPAAALVGLGGYLEHKLGAKVTTRVTALEARVAAFEAKVKSAL